MNEKGQFDLVLAFVIVALVILILFAFIIPLLSDVSTQIFTASEDVVDDIIEETNEINDEEVKASVQGAWQSTKDSYVSQQEIFALVTQYTVVILLIIIAIGFYLRGKSSVGTQLG